MFSVKVQRNEIRQTVRAVYDALKDAGFNPLNQMVGYLAHRFPSNSHRFISEHGNALEKMSSLCQYCILKDMLMFYLGIGDERLGPGSGGCDDAESSQTNLKTILSLSEIPPSCDECALYANTCNYPGRSEPGRKRTGCEHFVLDAEKVDKIRSTGELILRLQEDKEYVDWDKPPTKYRYWYLVDRATVELCDAMAESIRREREGLDPRGPKWYGLRKDTD